ncbi:MAG: hypothetical protein WC428_02200 [Candidatus Paceibacterota bacterium]
MIKTIGVHANITEVNTYEFDVQIDENATKEQQDTEAKEKVRKFLSGNIPSPNIGSPFIDGVKCIDVDYGVYCVNNVEDEIEVNEG